MAVLAEGTGLLAHFSALEDPRQSGKVLYPLPEILLVVLCGTLSGCDDFVELALWGREHLSFLRVFSRSRAVSRATTPSTTSSGRSIRPCSKIGRAHV